MRLKVSRFTRALACLLVSFTLVLAAIEVSAGAAAGPATATVNQLLASIGKLRTTADPGQRDKLIASIDQSLAIRKLSEKALGAQWSKLDSAEQAHFVALVKQLLEKIAYPNASQFFAGFTVNVLGEEAQSPHHIVRTTVKRSEGGAISIDYVLEKIEGRWVVVDVILDRQSLADSMTSQVQATLKSGSYQDLVAQLQARVAQANPPAS